MNYFLYHFDLTVFLYPGTELKKEKKKVKVAREEMRLKFEAMDHSVWAADQREVENHETQIFRHRLFDRNWSVLFIPIEREVSENFTRDLQPNSPSNSIFTHLFINIEQKIQE